MQPKRQDDLYLRDAALSRGSDLAALDASQLRIARQRIAVGALERSVCPTGQGAVRHGCALAQRLYNALRK
jgi:chemosensory pili system protein ChpA (sensor histidine kinase/response regulator)